MTSTKDINAFELFLEKANKLNECGYVNLVAKHKPKLSINLGKDFRGKIEFSEPNEDAINSFVLIFRFFIQDNERCSINNLSKIISTLNVDKKLEQHFNSVRTSFKKYLDSNSLIVIDSKMLTNWEIFDVFFYGGLAHSNLKKKTIYDKWCNNPITKRMVKMEFHIILNNYFNFIFLIQEIVGNLLLKIRAKNV